MLFFFLDRFAKLCQAMALLIVGMLLGWGVGAVAMKAALAARNQTVLKSTLLRAQEG